jgi:hypothetical protein
MSCFQPVRIPRTHSGGTGHRGGLSAPAFESSGREPSRPLPRRYPANHPARAFIRSGASEGPLLRGRASRRSRCRLRPRMSFSRLYYHCYREDLHYIVVDAQPALAGIRWNNDSPFKNRAAFDLLACFMMESGPNCLGNHCFVYVYVCLIDFVAQPQYRRNGA